ncbi:meiosis protein mei2 [Dichotomopilus funicola]|uniref:Meiosis protein mei2 n=1 Tax=Dichotomopilus funicola TaxID=1934379 RepID=A0AAN6ZLP2_9PEZI|nr:meiosis protein mei2 [Dichotomopilus funicola]
MAQVQDSSFNPSSPHSSSGGADSYKQEGTPDTRLTVFSPDENLTKSNRLLSTTFGRDGSSNHAANVHTTSQECYGGAQGAVERDPFVSNTTIKPEQKLSPTASAFRPVSGSLAAYGPPNTPLGANISVNPNRQLFAPQATAKFSDELGVSRCLVLYSQTQPVNVVEVEEYLVKLERLGSPCRGKRHIVPAEGKVFLHLPNVRDARNARENAQLGSPHWQAAYVSSAEFYKVCGSTENVDPISDGKIQVTAFDQGVSFSAVHVETVVHTFLDTQGEVFALLRQSEPNEHAFRAMVEYSDADVAVSVVHRFNGMALGLHGAAAIPRVVGSQVTSSNNHRNPSHHMPAMYQGVGIPGTPQNAGSFIPRNHLGHSPVGPHGPPQYAPMHPAPYQGPVNPGPNRLMLDHTPTRTQSVSHMAPMTPISGSMQIVSSPFNTTPPDTPMGMHSNFTSPRSNQHYGRTDSRRQSAMRVNRSPYFNNGGHHNHVDITRIRDGIDVRTTIMLRNIPNKVDQAMLKRIIDESSWGKYDFMYLRIDFANDCNVGYAFINFVDPLDIIDFVNARGNQRWNCFKSDKIAEISYATIQGKDCLVQKFRNSSVMLEAPHYRPKLYFTSNGPRPELAGQEEPFPEPDNQSKMKRSCENAEHVGLFTPNAGQHFRDEQRRRRSQYDRGTRLAALEEYDYNTQARPQGYYLQQ